MHHSSEFTDRRSPVRRIPQRIPSGHGVHRTRGKRQRTDVAAPNRNAPGLARSTIARQGEHSSRDVDRSELEIRSLGSQRIRQVVHRGDFVRRDIENRSVSRNREVVFLRLFVEPRQHQVTGDETRISGAASSNGRIQISDRPV